MMSKFAWIIVLLVLGGISITQIENPHTETMPPEAATNLETTTILIEDNEYVFEVADTFATRRQGLSDRAELGAVEGLLFIFDKDDYHGIWMKDMNFAIDIIWLDQDLQVVTIEHNVLPNSFPQVFKPVAKARYVIEVPAGWATEQDLSLNSQLSWTNTST